MKLLRTVLLGALAFGQETGGEVDELDERGIRSNEQAILLGMCSNHFTWKMLPRVSTPRDETNPHWGLNSEK